LLEPLDHDNRAALGYDMAADPVRRTATERARDTGKPAASAQVLAQHGDSLVTRILWKWRHLAL
jgi:CHASE1-domain containing sensor protein